jgi:hypothetical protein
MKKKLIEMGFLREEAGEGGEGGAAGGDAGGDAGAQGGQGGDAGGDKPWYSGAGLSDEVLTAEGMPEYLNKYKTVEEAIKGGYHASKQVGKQGIVPPAEGAPEEEVNAFYDKLGRPPEPDGYEWKPPEGMEVDKEIFTERTKELHAAGLTQEQHSKVMDVYAAEVQRMNEAFQNEQAQIAQSTEANLRKEMGNDYDANMALIKNAVDKYGMREQLMESGMINNEGFLRMVHDMVMNTSEGSTGGQGGRNTGTIDDRIAAIKSSDDWSSPDKATRQAAAKRVMELEAQRG